MLPRSLYRTLGAANTLVLALLAPSTASAALLGYEGFSSAIYNTGASGTGADFATDDLRGQGSGSGSGFTGNWAVPTIAGNFGAGYWTNTDSSTVDDYFRAATGQGAYVDSNGSTLITTGGQGVFENSGGANPRVSLQRNFSTGNSAPEVLYMSSLVTFDGTNDIYMGMASTNGGASYRPFEFGFVDDGRLVLAGHAAANGRTVLTTGNFMPGTYLLVARSSNDGFTNDTLDLWINPVLGDELASGAPILTLNSASTGQDTNFHVAGNAAWSLDGFVIDAGADGAGSSVFDEIRIGETFADVTPFTPVPEPSAAALAALALSACLRRRRKM